MMHSAITLHHLCLCEALQLWSINLEKNSMIFIERHQEYTHIYDMVTNHVCDIHSNFDQPSIDKMKEDCFVAGDSFLGASCRCRQRVHNGADTPEGAQTRVGEYRGARRTCSRSGGPVTASLQSLRDLLLLSG